MPDLGTASTLAAVRAGTVGTRGQGRYGDYHGIFIRTHSDHGGYTFNGTEASGSFPVTDNVAYHFQETYIFILIFEWTDKED